MTTNIEWVKNPDGTKGYTINPVKGLCPMACSYCYARRIYKRFKWNPEIRYDPDAFKGLPSKPARVFVGSTMELFGDWVDRDWMHMTFAKILARPQHTFIFLTKQCQNLPREFPSNCWVGVTALNDAQLLLAETQFEKIKANVKFLSLEPLRNQLDAFRYMKQPQWVIIGQQTPVSRKTEPKIEWVREIVEAADRAGTPVFLKNNLRRLLVPEDCSKPNYLMDDIFWASEKAQLRQEMLNDYYPFHSFLLCTAVGTLFKPSHRLFWRHE